MLLLVSCYSPPSLGQDWSSLDKQLYKTIIDVLQNAYPARVKMLIAVNPSWFTGFLIGFLKMIAKEKVAGKMQSVKDFNELAKFVDHENLTHAFGGTRQFDLDAWVELCIQQDQVRFFISHLSPSL